MATLMGSSAPIKIAFFHIMGSNFSGASKNIFRLIRRIDPEKLELTLVGQTENELTQKVRESGIEIVIVPYPPALDVYGQGLLKLKVVDFLRILGGLWEYNKLLIKFYRAAKPQVVWADNIKTFFFIYTASKLSGCRIIWNIWSEPEGKVAWCLHRIGLILADIINLEYKRQAQKIFGSIINYSFFKRKLVPLYTGVTDFERLYGVDIKEELHLSSDDILILMASNISPTKGQLDLIKVMEMLVKKHSNLQLLFAGQPPETHLESLAYDAMLKEYVKKENLFRNIHFLGWRSDIRDLMQQSDIYVSTSYSESFPDAVREAMLVGKPVVVTNVGGTFELVKIGVSGFLFEPGDIQSLSEYLGRLLPDQKLRESFGKEGEIIIKEKFSTKVYVRNFEKMVIKFFNKTNRK